MAKEHTTTQAIKIKAGLAPERGQHKVLNKVYTFYWC